jgi:hypothetical protein
MDMSETGMDPADPVWTAHLEALKANPSVHGTQQPDFDPDELWCELPELKKVSPAAVMDLGEALRQAGIPVVSTKTRRAGLLSGAKANVTLSVPERLRSEAMALVASRFPQVSP